MNIQKKDKIYHAARFFGINRQKLKILFNRFKNIKNIANADKKEFRGIKSIGKKTAEKMRNNLESDIFK